MNNMKYLAYSDCTHNKPCLNEVESIKNELSFFNKQQYSIRPVFFSHKKHTLETPSLVESIENNEYLVGLSKERLEGVFSKALNNLENSMHHWHYSFLNLQKDFSYVSEYNDDNKLWVAIESWIINTKACENISSLISYLNNIEDLSLEIYCLIEFLNEISNLSFSNKSFINFIRYYPVIRNYLFEGYYTIMALDNLIRLEISIENINLVLHFNENFLADFYSSDNEEKTPRERLIYSMNGSFSSSSTLRKSYKIERLLSMFDKKIFKLKESDNNSKIDRFKQFSEFSRMSTVLSLGLKR
ncbi:hypothetical protein [Acinetobacter sp. ANC 3791]|uniref:hypothetical protein n=1 Tax=Acinetobacter sp. ANC 3791 TaxID=2529836 RepID=UPI001039B32C|nr:hypothetical protein [Acinetobacter sp. ANC 3791]TCB86316.1 hypothetical protein E0H90_00380 [Acinetobacter sp. ANC 3791]